MSSSSRPNIILIVADDLDAATYRLMPNTLALLGKEGTTFSRFYVTTPICCPSRASILRGQYAHNHGVLKNGGEDGGFHTFYLQGREQSTLATWLHDAGYRTALVGKYLNGYPLIRRRFSPDGVAPTYVPPGWDEWYSIIDRDAFASYDYELNENGHLLAYGNHADDYVTDVLAARATHFVEQCAAANNPFFLYLATLAPHWPSVPAPRHADAFPDARAPRPPSFDEPDVSDKPQYLRNAPRLSEAQIRAIDNLHRRRMQSLLSVDDMVAALIRTLHGSGVLEQTYVFLTSDHGWHEGEHRLPFGKQTPYEGAIRAPLLVRGPGITAGRVIELPALNIDLAPTISETAGIEPPAFVDGRSLMRVINDDHQPVWRNTFLVEHLGLTRVLSYPDLGNMPQVPTYRALRMVHLVVGDLLYAEYETGERELYDLHSDPHQLDNAVGRVEETRLARWSTRLNDLRVCAGVTCRNSEDAPLEASAVDGLGSAQDL